MASLVGAKHNSTLGLVSHGRLHENWFMHHSLNKTHEFHKLDNRSHETFDINFVQYTLYYWTYHENRNTNQMFWAWNAHQKNYLIILKCNYIFIWTILSRFDCRMRISRDKYSIFGFSLLQWTSDGLSVNFVWCEPCT